MSLFTFTDAFDSLIFYLGGAPSDANRRDCYQAIDEALRDVVNAHTWSYLYKTGRINTRAPFTDGTISIQLQSGPYANYVTLDGAVFPTWAADGSIHVGNVVYQAEELIDPTHLTLRSPLVTNVDVPAGTSYRLYQDAYLLPEDFIAGDQALYERVFGGLVYQHPREWLFGQRYYYQTGTPQYYSIMGDSKYPGRLLIKLSPIPVEAATLDFVYKRRPRPILWQEVSSGTVQINAGSRTVAGQGTDWSPLMVGSILRVSNNTKRPTWMPGGNPAIFEGVIDSIQDVALLNLASTTVPAITKSAATYVISDPIDIETGSMLNAYLRACEYAIAKHRTLKDKPSVRPQYISELRRAKEADSRTFAGRYEGDMGWHRQRMKDMPLGPDLPIGIS
jgi:hypothetical protein